MECENLRGEDKLIDFVYFFKLFCVTINRLGNMYEKCDFIQPKGWIFYCTSTT